MVKLEWDYTELADAYLRRPGYAPAAIDEILARSGSVPGDRVCDVGAGTGNLTVPLARRGLAVIALEPNRRMADLGARQTADFPEVKWVQAVAEDTGQPDGSFHLVTFASSFNVTDQPRALREAARILRPGDWLACLFNHRELADPIQHEVQCIIEREVPEFRHGSRREDQLPVIAASGLFGPIDTFAREVRHRLSRSDYVQAWYSHCTLKRQAGDRFAQVVQAIADRLLQRGLEDLEVPYQTRVWMAQRL